MQIHISNTLINIHMFTLAKINTGLIKKKKNKLKWFSMGRGKEWSSRNREGNKIILNIFFFFNNIF